MVALWSGSPTCGFDYLVVGWSPDATENLSCLLKVFMWAWCGSTDSELMFHMDDDKTSEVSCSSSGRIRRLSLQSSDRSYCYHSK
ncbi:hypothetical protein TNCV_5087223 [Trichonephila clavipes]|nr:hypothetical protein TNCV_5087223 [Trichonephila clavipes]